MRVRSTRPAQTGASPSIHPLLSATTGASKQEIVTFHWAKNQTETGYASVEVPKGVRGIFSITALYKRESTGDLTLQFNFSHIKIQAGVLPFSVELDQTDAGATYTGSGTDAAAAIFTVPSASYNGLTNVTDGDIIGVEITCCIASTYTNSFKLYGLIFNWQ